MKKCWYQIILCVLIMMFFVGCNSKPVLPTNEKQNSNQEVKASDSKDYGINKDTSGLTIEKIKEKYTTENIGKVVDISTYQNYVLVEYSNDSAIGQGFDLYNLKTGDRDIMPLNSKARVFQFASGDYIIFESDGVDPLNGHRFFPFYMVCSRVKEVTGYDGDFKMTMTDLYKRVQEGFEFGVKRDVLISDLKVTLTGIEVSFAPMKGKEGEFYTAYSTIPVVRASYVPDKNQFVLEFKNTAIDPKIMTRKISEQNGYVSSVELREDGTNALVTINLKDTAKFYNAKVDHMEPSTDGSPFVRFTFRNSIF